MHAYQGSIRLLEDGTIEWCKQENKHKFDSDELITAYMSAMDIICEDQIDSVRHSRRLIFQLSEVSVPRCLLT